MLFECGGHCVLPPNPQLATKELLLQLLECGPKTAPPLSALLVDCLDRRKLLLKVMPLRRDNSHPITNWSHGGIKASSLLPNLGLRWRSIQSQSFPRSWLGPCWGCLTAQLFPLPSPASVHSFHRCWYQELSLKLSCRLICLKVCFLEKPIHNY